MVGIYILLTPPRFRLDKRKEYIPSDMWQLNDVE